MINRTEAEERAYLDATTARIRRAAEELDERIRTAGKDIVESKKYVWENRAQLDPAERAANVVDILTAIDRGESVAARRDRFRKLESSPYFGRVDFMANDRERANAYYIGVFSFGEQADPNQEIYDWRSPVASLFYDYAVGPASYIAPEGDVDGEIGLKRQYRIRQGRMEYMLESAININDEVLRKELSRASDEKMKNIAATIQKEQNEIIRNDYSHELIIQGVAGSGKTSVALHRIAFLLYRHKLTLASRNILILSPNKVFSDYISNVLPELGEEPIAELGFDDIADRELAGAGAYQTFAEQVAELTASGSASLIERIRYKTGAGFVRLLDEYADQASERFFCPADIRLDNVYVAKERIAETYGSFAGLPVKLRADRTAAAVAGRTRDQDGGRLSISEANNIKAMIRKMLKKPKLLGIYKDFYDHIGKPELLKPAKPRTLEYSDVFPLVYLKLRIEGAKEYGEVKHLVVDEMQDYTVVQYAVLSLLFKCKKTILGDVGQSVNPYSSSTVDDVRQAFPEADVVQLFRSYRSTFEIIEFARRIKPDSRIVPIERHGAPPQTIRADDADREASIIGELISQFEQAAFQTMGIVCKTQAQAEALHRQLTGSGKSVRLLDFGSDRFYEGAVVTTAHMAKGLEFDHVVVPFADGGNYRTEMDRCLLYIACTRAMHALTLTFHGTRSPLLD
ncbi:HelD family protein [Cohnella cellulosilytica]|uniref:HelD family protein n=1 Tax=Cohnella cellulosilytica TaxID=986710 RepID=A0ABW2F900_9BACL